MVSFERTSGKRRVTAEGKHLLLQEAPFPAAHPFQQEQTVYHLRRHVADVERINMDGSQFPFGLGRGAHRQ